MTALTIHNTEHTLSVLMTLTIDYFTHIPSERNRYFHQGYRFFYQSTFGTGLWKTRNKYEFEVLLEYNNTKLQILFMIKYK